MVSIGLPVYNGENYLEKAVASILQQTYPHFEIVISDNGSTDGTGRICRQLAAGDQRIRYVRNEANVGAARNYNRVFELSRGEYFKWAAHDDVLAPTFLERTVEVLDSNPEVVACSARTGRINEMGKITGAYRSDPTWNESAPSTRFRSLVLTRHACVAVFGVVRRDVLRRTPLIAPYVNSDRVLLAELGLAGQLFEVPEDLFFRRDHMGSSLRTYQDHRERVEWFDPRKSASLAFPEWKLVLGYRSAIARSSVPASERLKCYRVVAEWSLSQWRPLLADFKYAALGLVTRKSA